MKKIFLLSFFLGLICFQNIGFSQNQTNMYYKGEMNNWGSTVMTFDDLGTDRWIVTIQSDGDDTESNFKFANTTDWSDKEWGRGDVVTKDANTTWFNNGGNGRFDEQNNKYYTFTIKDVASGNSDGFVLETSGDPVSISTVSQVGILDGGVNYASTDEQTVTITLSGTPSTEEKFYVRYSIDGWATDNFVLATGLGATVTATIPAYSAGVTVNYYVLSTTLSTGGDLEDYTDLCTIKYNTNGGSNYSYTTSDPRSLSTGLWNAPATWLFGSVPTSDQRVTIVAGDDVTVETTGTAIVELTIESGASLIIQPGKQLTVSEALTNNAGTSGVVLQSDATGNGSLLFDDSQVEATIERYIAGYTAPNDGWHLMSSPVNNFAIASSDFEPGANDDFFAFDEGSNTWLNQIVVSNNINNFTNGIGFLTAYQTTATRDFSGTINSVGFTFNDLSKGSGSGWHLLGNPFSTAITWLIPTGVSGWNATDIGALAKVLNVSNGNYIDISSGDPIPSTNGFFIQVADGSNSITIPTTARTHDEQNNYKTTSSDQLKINVTNDANGYSDICNVGIKQAATMAFDWSHDSHKMFGYATAPQLWSVIGTEEYSTNTLAPLQSSYALSLNFIAGVNSTYHLNFEGVTSFDPSIELVLEDLQTNTLIELLTQSSYSFQAFTTDDAERFILHFNLVNQSNEIEQDNDMRIFTSEDRISVLNPDRGEGTLSVFDANGRMVYNDELYGNESNVFSVNLASGIYMVRATAGSKGCSKKVFIR